MSEPAVALPLRGLVVFPGMIRSIPVGRDSSIRAIEQHLEQGALLTLVPQLDPDEEDPESALMLTVGTLGRVQRTTRLPDGSLRVLVEGGERVRIGPITLRDGATATHFTPFAEEGGDPVEVGGLSRVVTGMMAEWTRNQGMSPTDHPILAAPADDPVRVADQAAAQVPMTLADRLALLEEVSVQARLQLVADRLAVTIAGQRIDAELNLRVQAAMDGSQREFHLKEQLKAIRAELGDTYGTEADADEFQRRLLEADMPEEVRTEALREVDRLRRIHSDSGEYTVARTWLETVCDLPWGEFTVDTASLSKAQRVLDEDHHGLEKVKERLLEYLAVRQLQADSKGPILCFVGPPGVGKTSLGRSIARALGRNYGRIALGGIKDETEIRGHRRTYLGALPGRIIRALSRAGSANPVLVLDELDKLGADFRGDPASALLEVLDPEQNNAFVDHYLDVPVDLSQVLFIATANLVDPIPPALMDRLEIIEIPGYTEEEKVSIAKRFLLPRLSASHGLKGPTKVQITPEAIERVIRDYTREAGLRELERQLAAIHRKVARQVVEGKAKKVKVTDTALPRYLGPVRYFQEVAERVDQPGVVIGLAWTASGGDILFIEATRMPGKLSLKLTGSLGEVMKESAEAAMSWLRAHSVNLGLASEVFDASFHLHVPAGAIPKDGPSAGVTMVSALASLVTGRPARSRVAMTGEITLRGKVLPVGGVKEKVLAARRAGITEVILPARNEADLVDVPEELRRDLKFHFVATVDEVLQHALEA